MFSLITSYCSQKWYACLSLVGVQPSAPNGSLSDELGVPQVLASLSSDLLTQNTPNVNRSSQLITKPENEICVTCTTEQKQAERGRPLTHSRRWNTLPSHLVICSISSSWPRSCVASNTVTIVGILTLITLRKPHPTNLHKTTKMRIDLLCFPWRSAPSLWDPAETSWDHPGTRSSPA